MALKWTIDPEDQMMIMLAEGEVTRPEVNAMLDAMQAGEALAYRKMFDATKADTKMTADDLIALGVRLRAIHAQGNMGPLALVIPLGKEELIARVLGILAVPNRPMRLFADSHKARKWIKKQLAGSSD